MRIVVHHKQHYDWQDVPKGIPVRDADKKSGDARPGANGGWLMRVPVETDSYTEIHVSEDDLFHTLFHNEVRALRLSRLQAVHLHLVKYRLPNHTHPRWITKVEVDDDGPDDERLGELLAFYTREKVIDEADAVELRAAFKQGTPVDVTAADYSVAVEVHLKKQFKLGGS